MKTIRRICAAVMVAAMLFTLCACHKKDETVLTIGEEKIPSGLYISFISEAFNEFSTKVNDELDDGTTVENAKDYFAYEQDGKKCEDWVRDRAAVLAKEYAAIKLLFAEHDITLSTEETDYVKSYADYYWENGYKDHYENNGMDRDTYVDTLTYYTMRSKLFNFYYNKPDEDTGKGGIQEVPMTELLGKINEEFVLLEQFSIPLTSTELNEDGTAKTLTDDEKAAIKTKLEGYAARINEGKNTFAEIKAEYDKETNPESADKEDANVIDISSAPTTESTDATAEEDKEELKSIYPSSAVIYSKYDTNQETGAADTANYDKYSAIAKESTFAGYGKAFVKADADATEYSLIIFYDLSKDEYYADQNRSNLLNSLKEEDFKKLLADKAATLAFSTDADLVKFYSPKKLEF